MYNGVVEIGNGDAIIINSSKWNLNNQIDSVENMNQLKDMSLIYNSNKESIEKEDVMFIHHFADSGNVSKVALIEAKDLIESYLNNSVEPASLLGEQNKEDYIEKLKQSLPHLNQHLKDAGLDEIVLSGSPDENLEVAINSEFLNKIISVNEKIANRMTFEYVAHVIHGDKTDSNKNGLNWQEEYVKNQINSAIGMPIKYAPDFDGVPTDHGYFGEDGDGNIISYYSEIAGNITAARIDTIPGSDKKGLICTAYVDTIVHSDLAQWIKGRFLDGKPINTSVEICGKKDENDNQLAIKYESKISKFPKIPMEFDYIGSAILNVEPADDYAKFIIINQKGEEEEITMNLKEAIDKIAELSSENTELSGVKETLEATEIELSTANERVIELETKNTELQSYKDEKEEAVRINAFIEKLNAKFDEDTVKEFDKEIEKFKENSLEYNTGELLINMYEKSLEKAKDQAEKDAVKIEENSKRDKDDLFEIAHESGEKDEDDPLDFFEK